MQVKFVGNTIPLVRSINAINAIIRKKVEAAVGVDIPEMILNAPKIALVGGHLQETLFPQQIVTYEDIIKQWQLNYEVQQVAALLLHQYKACEMAILEPDRTIKTDLTMAMVNGLAVIGIKCLVVGPSPLFC